MKAIRENLFTTALLLAAWLLAVGCESETNAQPAAVEASVEAAPAEVRGVWLTTTANDAIANPQNTADTMRKLREIGLNTVYVECWKNGYTEFPSQVMDELIGVPLKINAAPEHLQRDLLEETLIEAHRNQLIHIAWFEYGFMAAYKDTHNDLRQKYPQWMTTTKDGGRVSDQNPFVWMNPLRPESRELLLGIVKEAVVKYDLDGVQLDDRIAWPVTMGYDPYTLEVYAKEHNGELPPDDPRDPQWIAWRAQKVTEFAEHFYTELKKERPNLIVSISPAIWRWCYEHYACDWPTWAANGWMDEYIPQVYRRDYASFARDWPKQLEAIGDRRDALVAGIAINGSGPDLPWDQLKQKLDLTRTDPGAGHCHWFSRGVLEVHPDELTAYYDVKQNGRAANPMLPADWRPAPIVLEQKEPGVWSADIPEDAVGAYRLIVKRDGRWSRQRTADLDAGPFTVALEDAEAVELLVDRRGHAPLK